MTSSAEATLLHQVHTYSSWVADIVPVPSSLDASAVGNCLVQTAIVAAGA